MHGYLFRLVSRNVEKNFREHIRDHRRQMFKNQIVSNNSNSQKFFCRLGKRIEIVSIRGERLTPRYPPVPETDRIRIRAGHRITALSAGGGREGVGNSDRYSPRTRHVDRE